MATSEEWRRKHRPDLQIIREERRRKKTTLAVWCENHVLFFPLIMLAAILCVLAFGVIFNHSACN
jgi:hypothetical protein